MIDIHCHILPGVDDGAASLAVVANFPAGVAATLSLPTNGFLAHDGQDSTHA